MDNYLLMGHILTCKVIPKDEVHSELWVGANRKWRVVPTYRLAQAQHNKVSSCATYLSETHSFGTRSLEARGSNGLQKSVFSVDKRAGNGNLQRQGLRITLTK